MAARRMAAEMDSPRVASPSRDAAVNPANRIQRVYELCREPRHRRMSIRYGDEDGRCADDGRRHEGEPFLAAVDPGPTWQKAQDRQIGAARAIRQIDVELLPIIRSIRLIDDTSRRRLRPSPKAHDVLDVARTVGVDQSGKWWQIVERHGTQGPPLFSGYRRRVRPWVTPIPFNIGSSNFQILS